MAKQDRQGVRTAPDLERKYDFKRRFDEVEKTTEATSKVVQGLIKKYDSFQGLYFYIRYSPYEDGAEMTEEPQIDTLYMGTLSTDLATAPEDPTLYTWCKIVGNDGATGKDGVGIASVVEQYYKSESPTELLGGEWTPVYPGWEDGTFVWTRSEITYTDESVETTAPICVSGSQGETGNDGVGISGVDVYYYRSTSNLELSGGSWDTIVPEWKDGMYMWSKTVTRYTDNTTNESEPVCITGGKGEKGEKGEDAVLLQILSSNGHLFKNSEVSTTLTVEILTGGITINSSEDMLTYFGADARIIWQEKKQGETEYTDLPADDPRISDKGFIFALNTEDLKMETVYMCNLDY